VIIRDGTTRDGTTTLFQEDLLAFEIDRLKEAVQTCDILIGGPPCQGFSTHRIKDSGVGDARNKLIHKYFDVVRALRPKIFLVENVPGLLWPRHAEYLEQFRRSAESEGYRLRQLIVCDAQDYGTPQRRKRVFLLGVDVSVGINSFQFPPPPEIAVSSCGHAFRPAPVRDENDIHMNHGKDLVEVFKQTPKNGGSRCDSGRILPCHKKHDGHKDVYGRIDPAKPAPTITTACIKPSKGRFVHPTETHGITLRQAARLQGFPDWFVFEGGLTAGGRQVGNAVPPRMAMHLLAPLKDACSK
jgi:DNA (cytosine-5)-methyltransferase 1